MAEGFSVRPASEGDQPVIQAMVRKARINPLGLDWRRFLIAVDPKGSVIGCGQVKPHRGGARELASIVVVESWRGLGVGRALVERLMADASPPLWLTCRSGLVPLYERFGFREIAADEPLPGYFRRLRQLARGLGLLSGTGEHLAVMVWRGG